ncbi:YwdI family protein [Bacillus sp. sid0103]|uniref:YwdI family protein n=1 Tax=Bacillus sp. sid0103 TaxID=2856337 RepID=UPI001C48FE27|nr:YwdI family protein [Bacillus sp. sid0103]MBV7505135.1 YwdI family protein [Bacillus sp. sid0103]
MNISVQKLLAKIEEELKLAKSSAKEESLREKVYSIKILCELLLDEKPALKNEVPVTPMPAVQPAISYQAFQQPVMNQPLIQQPAAQLQQPKKLDMEDEANGDSLFDF